MQVNRREDFSERVSYNFPSYPAYINNSFLSSYPNYSALSHWHEEIELIAVISGTMRYNVNGEIITLNKDEGIFVNSKQIHFGFSKDKNECNFICVVIHPVLLCASSEIESKYITPLINNEKLPFLKFSQEIRNGIEIFNCITNMWKYFQSDNPELLIQSEFFKLWTLILNNAEKTIPKTTKSEMYCFKLMNDFIVKNHNEKISLEEIACSGNVCKTSCITIFKKFTNQTPFEYLNEYRLRKAVELMKNSEMNITEIAFETGFNSASYFAETFRKYYGINPDTYRKAL